jgi:hypothetical protein
VLGETAKESPYELKSLQLDLSALNRCISEIKALPLSASKPPSSCREKPGSMCSKRTNQQVSPLRRLFCSHSPN